MLYLPSETPSIKPNKNKSDKTGNLINFFIRIRELKNTILTKIKYKIGMVREKRGCERKGVTWLQQIYEMKPKIGAL